ncbi:MAG: 30S ribosomal protein S18 [Patescibacteria group bacterium]|nr:30S ribosomal protein S18 [Patescibacteria group bacterium]
MAKGRCYLCKDGIGEIDFTDVELLNHYLTDSGKIIGRRRSRLCAKHERRVKKAIKRARNLGLMPTYIS